MPVDATSAKVTPALSAPLLATPARVTPPAATASARVGASRAATGAPRFAIEFGPFVTASDAERVERRLTEAGYSTVRTRQPSGAAVYAVLIERLPTTQEAKIIAVALREHGIHEAVIVSTDPVILRVGAPLPLRGAVELAERVRAAGHQVRLAAQPGEASALIVRHGAFASRTAADARRRELGQLDLPAHQIVQVR
jgi:cell division septation protein DedD